ncbi:MAG TPA: hypothetical protein VFM59_03925 [Salinimicrobium sp.]|nr:hypothetical protein [Salinimicrobium sp.]
MKFALFGLVMLLSFSCFAQKKSLKVLDATGISGIVLSSDEVFKISVSAAPVEEISIKTEAEGEYYNNISLDSEIKGNKLILSSRFQKNLQEGFDKLSAHKVFSLKVDLEIPEGMILEINSNLASVFCSGKYEALYIQLKSGSCYLENFTGNATVNTFNGNIEVETSNATVEANSRHGKMEISGNNFGKNKIILKSINGDISFNEVE